MIASSVRRGLPPRAIAITFLLALLTVDLAASEGSGTLLAVLLIALVVGAVVTRIATRWSLLIGGVALVELLVPSDGRYTVAASLPFKLEPYRLIVGVILIGWVIALLIDPRVRARATKFEGPLALIALATLGSEVLNPHRVGEVSGHAVKALSLWVSFVLFLYLVVSVVRKRAAVERLLTVLVPAGCFVALAALVQRRTGFNPFDHLHFLLPAFQYVEPPAALLRGGEIRATASAGHPIELSNSLAMLVPLAAYLAITRRQRAWWGAVVLLVLGDFAGGSRTGVVGLLAIIGVFLWLRPRQTLRCWPALLVVVPVLHFAAPGAIGGTIEGFFPKEGLVAQQSATIVGEGGTKIYANRLSRIGPVLHEEFAQHNPLFGEGYGTRVTGEPTHKHAVTRDNPNNAIILDNQWLGTLVETGILGVLGWLWLFVSVIWRLGARAKLERTTSEGWLPVALAASIAAFGVTLATYDAFSFVQAVLLVYVMIAFASIILWLPPTTGSPGSAAR